MISAKEKKFLRKCISCSSYKQKSDLLKITVDYNTKEVIVNNDNKTYGRSCYICKDKNCIEIAIKKSKISKSLKKNIEKYNKEKIITVLENNLVLQH